MRLLQYIFIEKLICNVILTLMVLCHDLRLHAMAQFYISHKPICLPFFACIVNTGMSAIVWTIKTCDLNLGAQPIWLFLAIKELHIVQDLWTLFHLYAMCAFDSFSHFNLTKECRSDLEPPYPRPKTSARTAQRLIAQGMGRKLSTTFGSSEFKKQEEERRNRILTRQIMRDEAWGPDDP